GNITGIDFTLQLGGIITGRTVLTGTATPLAFIQVCSLTYSAASLDAAQQRCTFSDTTGAYAIYGVMPGTHRVRALVVEEDNFIPSRFYNGTATGSPRWADAIAVTVTSGGTRPNVNFNLEEGGNIYGGVFAGDQVTPLANVTVTLEDGSYP